MTSFKQTELFPSENVQRQDYSATFADNMSLPVHRWFRYTAGFSAAWVHELILQEMKKGRGRVIDPFAGSGTVLLEGDMAQVESIGIEAHPYIFRIAKTKLCWSYDPEMFREAALDLLKKSQTKQIRSSEYPKLLLSCYPIETLHRLDTLKQTWLEMPLDDVMKDFAWFLITSILRITSPVGTAQWQYVLPNKTKAKVVDPYKAYEAKVYEMFADMRRLQARMASGSLARIFQEDARTTTSIPDGWGDLVITSPPYANNYDYADATRLEMTFWGDIGSWGDLQTNVRQHLVRACTQHVSGMGNEAAKILAAPRLRPIQAELAEVYARLESERLNHGGKKNYHWMIAAYFHDLAQVFHTLRKATSENCRMCFVIGDSAPYGVYVPVDRWLGELAVEAGFSKYQFEKLRDRNIKWKNRKHTIPLQEGRLWING